MISSSSPRRPLKELWLLLIIRYSITISKRMQVNIILSIIDSFKEIQLLAFKLCFLYFNWTGSIKVPGPVRYAHTFSNFIGDRYSVNDPNQFLPHENLVNRNTLFYIWKIIHICYDDYYSSFFVFHNILKTVHEVKRLSVLDGVVDHVVISTNNFVARLGFKLQHRGYVLWAVLGRLENSSESPPMAKGLQYAWKRVITGWFGCSIWTSFSSQRRHGWYWIMR